jgi:signal transduction histidine kinase
MKHTENRLLTAVAGILDSAVGAVIGPPEGAAASPQRLRLEYVTRLLVVVEPITVAAIVVFFFRGLDSFTGVRITALVIVTVCLFLLHENKYKLAIDVLFFGCVAMMIVNYVVMLLLSQYIAPYLPITALVLFAAIAVNGLYSGCTLRVGILLGIAIGFDIMEAFIAGAKGGSLMYARVGIMVLHVIAYMVGRFLIVYFDRVSHIAEARRIMNHRLEELVADARLTGAARLESFSHDIRSPITAIMGVQSLLADTNLHDEQKRYLEILSKSNRLLLEIVESILDPDCENGSCAPERPPVRRLLEAAIDPFRTLARSKGVDLKRTVSGNPAAPPLLRANALRVLGNLVDNALKYTDSGMVVVSASETEKAGGGKELTISVADTGRGMSPERLTAVRAGTGGPDPNVSSSRGLGLTGSRYIVEEAGGSLSIDSVLGAGTTVTLRFPIES